MHVFVLGSGIVAQSPIQREREQRGLDTGIGFHVWGSGGLGFRVSITAIPILSALASVAFWGYGSVRGSSKYLLTS